jgi:predicted metal-binding transcription factor (methanogenesis marker protein 9)
MNETEIKQLLTQLKEQKANPAIINKLTLALKLKGQKKHDEAYIKEASSITCWNGLEYCCASPIVHGKQCVWRDLACDLLELSEADLEDLKDTFRKGLMKKLKTPS